ncbi:unnamed protein product, partial [Ascophyllum nodosum]
NREGGGRWRSGRSSTRRLNCLLVSLYICITVRYEGGIRVLLYEVLDLVHNSCKRANLTLSLVFYGKSANYLQHLMRGANELLMFGMVARTNRIGTFSLPTCPRSRPKVEMTSVPLRCSIGWLKMAWV